LKFENLKDIIFILNPIFLYCNQNLNELKSDYSIQRNIGNNFLNKVEIFSIIFLYQNLDWNRWKSGYSIVLNIWNWFQSKRSVFLSWWVGFDCCDASKSHKSAKGYSTSVLTICRHKDSEKTIGSFSEHLKTAEKQVLYSLRLKSIRIFHDHNQIFRL
jgi:hypothetical protein